jgi:hypothetical protein
MRAEECCAQCHFCLAETNIATHQPIHDGVPPQVGENIGDGSRLVRCFLEGEGGLKGRILVAGWIDRCAANRLSLGIELQKLVCHEAHLLAHLRLCFLESLPAEAIELWCAFSGKLLNLVQSVNGQQEFVAPLVLHREKLDGVVADLMVGKPQVAPDSVLDVHDEVSS